MAVRRVAPAVGLVVIAAAAAIVNLVFRSCTLPGNLPAALDEKMPATTTTTTNTTSHDHHHDYKEFPHHNNACKRLGLPQPMHAIPLPPSAYEMDHGKTANYIMGLLPYTDIDPPIHLALPRGFTKRIDETTGRFGGAGNSRDTWNRAKKSKAENGIFIDIGGWVGDSSIPSAALGMDTYVFDPVRFNTNMIHLSTLANGCKVSEHLTIVNAFVGDRNSANESVYVTGLRSDNAAFSREQATKNVGRHDDVDYEQKVHMIKLDSFFPPGTRVQNLKIDVQGHELHVLRGAERLLKENLGRLHLRFEYDAGLLKLAGTNASDVLDFVTGLGYKIISKGEDVDME